MLLKSSDKDVWKKITVCTEIHSVPPCFRVSVSFCVSFLKGKNCNNCNNNNCNNNNNNCDNNNNNNNNNLLHTQPYNKCGSNGYYVPDLRNRK